MSTKINKSEDPYNVASVVFKNRHQGCPCAECGEVITDEKLGQSSFIGSIHIWCETEENS